MASTGSQERPLRGRLAVVTGGGAGIGKAICGALAEKGARLIVADINLAAAEAVANALTGASDDQKHVGMHVDIADSSSVQALFAAISEVCGKPASILVNCAGILLPYTSIVDTNEDAFDRVLSINLKGTFLMTQAAARNMLAGGLTDGAVVNISSIVAKTCGGLCSYVASKAAIVGLTKAVAAELADRGIRCNAVLPGATHNPDRRGFFTEEAWRRILASVPLGRKAQPREVADVVAFLCSPQSSYMTGAAVEVAGGWDM